jgi:hypothetical protein
LYHEEEVARSVDVSISGVRTHRRLDLTFCARTLRLATVFSAIHQKGRKRGTSQA